MRRVIYVLECAVVVGCYAMALVSVVWHPVICGAMALLVGGVYLADERPMRQGAAGATIRQLNGEHVQQTKGGVEIL